MKYQTTHPYEMRRDEYRIDASRLGQRLACRLIYAWLHFRQWRRESEAIRHLRQIDVYLLDDIGIDRWEIDAVVRDRSGYRVSSPDPAARHRSLQQNGGIDP
ncbi:MAG: hypothetical protein PVI79_18260 [Gammaproteobacteria bacterium]|jgi:uncharacterized protein YjiS (DUF1127 family)